MIKHQNYFTEPQDKYISGKSKEAGISYSEQLRRMLDIAMEIDLSPKKES